MRLLTLFLFFLSSSLFGQDAYHQSLLDNFQANYGIEGGRFLFSSNEATNFNNTFTYGNIQTTDEDVANRDFTKSKHIVVTAAGTNAWDAGMGTETSISVSQDDLILVTFWAKQNSGASQVFVFAEEATSFDKEYYFPLSFTPDWTQYFIAFKATRNFNIARLKFGFHLATMPQDINIAGFTALNYEDNYGLDVLPSSFSPFNYEGSEDDAPWRTIAEARIEDIRKSDLTVLVVNENSDVVTDAEVKIDMDKHDFGFGSALVTCRFPGNNCYDETYVEKVLDLDGKGHGFNECVNENALKWRGWEQQWLGTPEETVGAFQWLTDQGVTMRGHNIIWPGSDFLPDDVKANLNDLDYLRNRINERIEEMILHPELSQIVRDWDVLNEITTNRTLETAFDNDPSLENGRKIYGEIFSKVKELDPSLELYINDYMAISSGSANLIARYKSFLDELKADDVPFDGIGFQCHIGSIPNSIPQVEKIFDDFYQRYGKRMKVTEYDINDIVDEGIQAKYMRDLLTLTFSHPGMDAFIMWGFWDGNHWKSNAPMFYQDWSLKPSGEMFIQKVFNEWWTNEVATTNVTGQAAFRPYKGQHTITVTKGDATVEGYIQLVEDTTVTIVLEGASTANDLEAIDISLSPNPVTDGYFNLDFPSKYITVSAELYDIKGKLVAKMNNIKSGQRLEINQIPGTYQLKISSSKGHLVKTIIVQ